MTTTDKPSIAELQRKLANWYATDRWSSFEKAAPVLLEIAAAALAANSTACDCHGEAACEETCSAMRACRASEAALSKVRP